MKLSVIIPAYNACQTLARTLGSLRMIAEGHRGTDVQVVFVDDGSTDATREIAEAALPTLGLAAYRIITQANAGSGAARNRAFEEATGQWVYLLDADDELTNDPIPLLNRFGDRSLIACSVRFVKHGKSAGRRGPRLIRPGRHMSVMSAGNPYCPASLLLKRDRIDTLFNTLWKGREDWAFLIDNPRLFEGMATAPRVELACVHIHGQNKSSRYAWQGRYRSAIAEHVLDRLPADARAVVRNNLRIQQAIGRIQQREPAELRRLVRLPANPMLLLKLLVWKASCGDIGWIDHYGQS